MRLNTILPILLALVNLVSAKFHITSPSFRDVWKNNGEGTIEWSLDKENLYSSLSLYLVCENAGATTVLQIIKKKVALTTTTFVFRIPSNLQMCEGYFIKFVSVDVCGIKNVFFSSFFSITVNGMLQNPELCSGEKFKETDKSPKPPQLPESKEEKQDIPKHPEDHTPTKTTSETTTIDEASEPTSPEQPNPLETDETQKPISLDDTKESDQKSHELDESKPDTPTSPGSTSDQPDDKKPNDIDNSGSMITFKLFGALFTVVLALFLS